MSSDRFEVGGGALSSKSMFLVLTAAAVVGALALPLGLNFFESFRLAISIVLQASVGALLISKFLRVVDKPIVEASLWLGIGGLAVTLVAYVVASFGSMGRQLVMGLLQLLPLCLILIPSIRRGLRSAITSRESGTVMGNVGTICAVSYFSAAIIDWRLCLLALVQAPISVFVWRATRHSERLILKNVALLVSPSIAGSIGRLIMGAVGYPSTPREFAISSVDFDAWTSMGIGVLEHGPTVDMFKSGTAFGYHNLAPAWAAVSAEIAGVDAQITVAQTGYVVAAICAVGVVFVLADRATTPRCVKDRLRRNALAVFAVVGSVSALESRGLIDAESFTQAVSMGWVMVLLYLLPASKLIARRLILLGPILGSMVLAKTTTFLLVGIVLVIDFLVANGRRRLDAFWLGLVSAVIGVMFFWTYIRSAGDDAIFADVGLQKFSGEKWLSYVSDVTFTPVARAASSLPTFALLLLLLLVFRKPARSIAHRWAAAGVLSVLLSLVVDFGDQGLGQSYLFSSGVFLAVVAAVWHVSKSADYDRRLSGDDTTLIWPAYLSVFALCVPMLVGVVSGLGWWSLRIQGRSELLTYSGVSVVLAITLLASLVLRRVRTRESKRHGAKFNLSAWVARSGLALALTGLLAFFAGNSFAYAIREPGLTATAVLAGDVTSSDFLAELTESRSRRRLSASAEAMLRCLRLETSSGDIFASAGVEAHLVLGELQIRAYVVPEMASIFPEDSKMRTLLEGRISRIAGVLYSRSSADLVQMRMDKVRYLIFRADLVDAGEEWSDVASHPCSNDALHVWVL
jgi:hypothetical protein